MNGNTKVSLIISVIILFFILVNPIYGQEQNSKSQDKGGMGYFIGGVGWLLESDRNAIVYSAGGGGHSITNKWIIGGEGHSSFGPDNAGGYGFTAPEN